MKFKIISRTNKEAQLYRWHKWFAWHPVSSLDKDKNYDLYWLVTVYRCRVPVRDGFYYEYRENEFDMMTKI